MKENEYDNGHTERQTVGSNPPELPQIRVSVLRTTSHRNHSAMLT